MEVSEQRIVISSSWFSPERELQRTKGLHLSHILNYMEVQAGVKRTGSWDTMNNFSCAGFLWERVVERLVELNPMQLWEWLFERTMVDVDNPRIIRPGEQCVDAGACPVCDGEGCKGCQFSGKVLIRMTPDGLDMETASTLEEWKFTTKKYEEGGIRHQKFARWVQWQIPAYLYALYLKECRLRVYYIRGNYQSPEPIWAEYLLTYAEIELQEIFDCIAANARVMITEGLVDYAST